MTSSAHVLSFINDPASEPRLRPDRLHVKDADLETLLLWMALPTTPRRVTTRCAIVLLASRGWSDMRLAQSLGVTRRTVALWKKRFMSGGPAALRRDAPGRGRKRGRNQEIVARILSVTQQPPISSRRWTVRTVARAVGVSHATVQRVWRDHGVKIA